MQGRSYRHYGDDSKHTTCDCLHITSRASSIVCCDQQAEDHNTTSKVYATTMGNWYRNKASVVPQARVRSLMRSVLHADRLAARGLALHPSCKPAPHCGRGRHSACGCECHVPLRVLERLRAVRDVLRSLLDLGLAPGVAERKRGFACLGSVAHVFRWHARHARALGRVGTGG